MQVRILLFAQKKEYMVFGNTYCAISHLEIKDGDECILMPLGFQIKQKFDRWNEIDINALTYLYLFIATEPVLITFGGNIAMIKHIVNGKECDYEDYQMFMLIHKGFYEQIIGEKTPWYMENIQNLPLHNTTYWLWEKGREIIDNEKIGKWRKLEKKEITPAEWMQTSTPQWMIDIYKVAMFMGKMGIPPHPVFCNDQHGTGEDYEKIRKNAMVANVVKASD